MELKLAVQVPDLLSCSAGSEPIAMSDSPRRMWSRVSLCLSERRMDVFPIWQEMG